ncbi:MAG: heavy-metal-associated domain-containing protein [Pedobacter sp.]|nr:MAG: heavy-metal-associated domain-containing protein [Pedobacter sp.]
MATENDSTINLPLEGMDSEHCALIIDKGLSKVQGIKSHKVELNNNQAVIVADETAETVKNAVAAIRDLGYDVTTVNKNFPILNIPPGPLPPPAPPPILRINIIHINTMMSKGRRKFNTGANHSPS